MSTQVVIAFGSNLGEREATIVKAVETIAGLDNVDLIRMSSLYESAALKPEGIDESAPEDVNAVGVFETTLTAIELLAQLAQIELDFGRVRAERWGDRTLDLDIIWMDGITSSTEELTLPHPRAHERSFVLIPWLEVVPEAKLNGRAITELAQGMHTELRVLSTPTQVVS